ncbi:hypothetical protein ACLOJK_038663 [Asimina triloba]
MGRIPPAFVKYMKKDVAQVTLDCPNGMLWHVKLEQRPSGLYLQNGWQEFVNEHCLQKHDLLVFQYDGGVKLTVQIYGQSACEKKDVCIKKTPCHCNCHDERMKRVTRKKKSLDPRKPSNDKTLRQRTESVKSRAVPGKATKPLYLYRMGI